MVTTARDDRIGQFATRWLDQEGKHRNHICVTCDHEWPVETRYFRWPIRAHLAFRHRHEGHHYWRPRRWGWEWGSDRLWRRWFVRVWRWGCVCVSFGPRKAQPQRDAVVCPACGIAFWRRPILKRERAA